jgi:hypothetical protein
MLEKNDRKSVEVAWSLIGSTINPGLWVVEVSRKIIDRSVMLPLDCGRIALQTVPRSITLGNAVIRSVTRPLETGRSLLERGPFNAETIVRGLRAEAAEQKRRDDEAQSNLVTGYLKAPNRTIDSIDAYFNAVKADGMPVSSDFIDLMTSIWVAHGRSSTAINEQVSTVTISEPSMEADRAPSLSQLSALGST